VVASIVSLDVVQNVGAHFSLPLRELALLTPFILGLVVVHTTGVSSFIGDFIYSHYIFIKLPDA
jgi:hypothetical protein